MLHELFKDFVFKFNIRNGELASQKKLNESVNILKKETDDLYNRSEIIRGELAFPWNAQTYYKAGEIASYHSKNYMVIPGQESINELPSESYKWEETVRADWTMELDPNGYIHKDNEDPYVPSNDFNPATKKYVDDVHREFSVNLNINDGINFLPLNDNMLVGIEHITGNGLDEGDTGYIPIYTPTAEAHPANKKYVDDQIEELAEGGSIVVGHTLNSERLGGRTPDQYMSLESDTISQYPFMAIKNNDNPASTTMGDWMRTPSGGLLPYNNNIGSNIGSENWKFKDIWVKTLHADTVISDAHVIVETHFIDKYESDDNYEPGTILRIGDATEVSIFNDVNTDKVAGIIAKEIDTTEFQTNNKVYSALKGKFAVRIKGPANRGDYINASYNGVGVASLEKSDITVGICINAGDYPGNDYTEYKVEVKI